MGQENIFGERVLGLRKARGLTQKELGEAVGLSYKAISTIESGARGTSVEKLIELAVYFRVSTDYLLGITDDPAWRGSQEEE